PRDRAGNVPERAEPSDLRHARDQHSRDERHDDSLPQRPLQPALRPGRVPSRVLRSSRVTLRVLVLVLLARVGSAQSLDLPRPVEGPAGVAGVAGPVTFGVPFPKGAVRDVTHLVLFGPDGKPVPAAFRVVNRWWDDAATQLPSIQWAHAD